MLDGNPDLNALLETWRLNSSAAPYLAELYTIRNVGGDVLARWTSADQEIKWDGYMWALGPGVSRSQISRTIGTSASELDVALSYDDSVTMPNGEPLAAFIAGGGFFFATLALFRAYAPDPSSPVVGILPKFNGRITKLGSAGETQTTLTVSDWRSLLNAQVPVNTWQPPCNHIIFDRGCKLNRDEWQVTGVVAAGSSVCSIRTNLPSPADYLDLGKVTFNSGVNAGLSRTIKSQAADGTLTLVLPLPVAPNAGDKIIAYPGCDLTTATCRDKFDNLRHRKGFEYTPVPETAAP